MNKKLNQVLSAVLLTAALLAGQTTNAQVSGTGTEKPSMMVYLLKTKPELLQSSAPIYDEDTDQQW